LSYTSADIVPQIAQGNRNAFESLFKSHYSNLCGYAVKYVWELDQAEEIVQKEATFISHHQLNHIFSGQSEMPV
jgi:DNA-directed RNA polymerase specialized sigma24 family protein